MNAKRFFTFACALSTALLLLSPIDAAAQHSRGGHGGGGGHAAPARPSGGDHAVTRRPGGGHPGYPGGGYYRPYSGGYRGYYGYYRPYYYSPYFYNGFYASFYYGLGWYPYYWDLAYGYPYGYGYYGSTWGWGPYSHYAYGAWSSVRLEMKPRDAQVFVDGYYVGVVDDFDGIFQRLDVPAGQHDLTIYMPGYQTWREQVMFQPGEGYHYKGTLQPLPPGTPPEPRPQPTNPPRTNAPYNYGPPPGGDPNSGGGESGYPAPPYRQPPPPRGGEMRTEPMRGESGSFGTLNLRVQPGDAVVQIDGERWDSPEGGSRLVVQLAAGSHRVEVRKDGFRPYSTTIQIRPGEQQSLNVVLPQQ